MKGKVGGQWNKIFMEIYKSILHVFLPFSPVSLTELCSLSYGLKDLFTLHKLVDKVDLETDDVTRVRKDVDLHGQLWANGLIEINSTIFIVWTSSKGIQFKKNKDRLF